MKRIKKHIFWCLTALVILLLIVVSGCSKYYKNPYIQATHIDIGYSYDNNKIIINNVYCNKMQGSSMNPSLFEGNVVCFKEYTNQELKQGNIIDYSTSGIETVHRIIGLQQDLLIVKGDNTYVQEKINYSDIKGILVATIYD